MTKNQSRWKEKQDWMDAVMADSSLTHATRVYAYGIYKHMYGIKDESWPGAKAIHEATGLNDGHYYKYNDALSEAGYLEVTSRRGTSNEYKLTLPTASGGNHLPPPEVTPPPVAVPPTSTRGTNTTSNTSKKISKKDNKQEPVGTDVPPVSPSSKSKSLRPSSLNDAISEVDKHRWIAPSLIGNEAAPSAAVDETTSIDEVKWPCGFKKKYGWTLHERQHGGRAAAHRCEEKEKVAV